uniref:atlastin-3-like n=1 Tax=Styela clava TaxID=7725 RepID=UPI001939DDC4|nr:atlastin-3-like [Styela clava]
MKSLTVKHPFISRHPYERIFPFERTVSSSDAKLVPIAKIDEDKLVIDEEALTTILTNPEVSELPVALLSVSGAFRKGKSFLLNFFLRYMRQKGYNNPDWLGKDNIADGFKWRGGKAPVTQGIVILNEPFIVDVETQKVAVFLMDTQGLFDSNSDRRLCTQIFALSTLLSSIQVFNLSQQIQENDLEYLQCFTEYARAAQAAKASHGPSFQKLMFVIRDWQELEDHDYGLDSETDSSGRTGYLNDLLSCASKNSELTAVRKYLHKSFNDIQCFFLPHPGLNVAVTRKDRQFKGELKDVATEFLYHVQVLADLLLNPKHLVPKKIYGEVITGNSLLNYAISCSKSFSRGNLPEPESMIQNSADVMNLQALNAAVDMYAYEMDKALTKSKYMEEDEVKDLNKLLVKQSMDSFDKNCSPQSKEAAENVRRNLVDTLMEQYELYKRRNFNQGEVISRQVSAGATALVQEYSTVMLEIVKKTAMEESELSAVHKQNHEMATNKFQSKFQKSRGFYEAMEKLQTDISSYYSVLKKLNFEKLNTERTQKKENETKMMILISDYLENYNGGMYEFTKSFVHPPYFVEREVKIREDVLKKFTTEAEKISKTEANIYKEILRQKMKEEFNALVKNNEENKTIMLKVIHQKKRSLAVEYRFLMQLGMRDAYVEPKVLQVIHDKFEIVLAERMIRDDDIFQVCYLPLEDEILKKGAEELRSDLRKWYKIILSTNEKNKDVFLKTTRGSKAFLAGIIQPKKDEDHVGTSM